MWYIFVLNIILVYWTANAESEVAWDSSLIILNAGNAVSVFIWVSLDDVLVDWIGPTLDYYSIDVICPILWWCHLYILRLL
jgi:hypothetical protein